jgi:hypothetical protein
MSVIFPMASDPTAKGSDDPPIHPGTGLVGTGGGANSTYTLAVNNNVVATVSGTK